MTASALKAKDYPRIGSILVSKNGNCIVYVWPNESSSTQCFTGVELLTADVSSLWLKSHFETCNLYKRQLLVQYRRELVAARKLQGGAQ
jgi:hypothetical protein